MTYSDIDSTYLLPLLEDGEGHSKIACLILRYQLSIDAVSETIAEHISEISPCEEVGEKTKAMNEKMLLVADVVQNILLENIGDTDFSIEDLDVDEVLIKVDKIEEILVLGRKKGVLCHRMISGSNLFTAISVEELSIYSKSVFFMSPPIVKNKSTIIEEMCRKNPRKGVGETFKIRLKQSDKKNTRKKKLHHYTATIEDALRWSEVEDKISFVQETIGCLPSQLGLVHIVEEEYKRLILINNRKEIKKGK